MCLKWAANQSPMRCTCYLNCFSVFLPVCRSLCIMMRVYLLTLHSDFVGVCTWMCLRECVCEDTVQSDTPTKLWGEMQESRTSTAARLLPLLCCVYATAGYVFTPLERDVTPRVTVMSSGKHKHTWTRYMKIRNTFNSTTRDACSRLLNGSKKNLPFELRQPSVTTGVAQFVP